MSREYEDQCENQWRYPVITPLSVARVARLAAHGVSVLVVGAARGVVRAGQIAVGLRHLRGVSVPG